MSKQDDARASEPRAQVVRDHQRVAYDAFDRELAAAALAVQRVSLAAAWLIPVRHYELVFPVGLDHIGEWTSRCGRPAVQAEQQRLVSIAAADLKPLRHSVHIDRTLPLDAAAAVDARCSGMF